MLQVNKQNVTSFSGEVEIHLLGLIQNSNSLFGAVISKEGKEGRCHRPPFSMKRSRTRTRKGGLGKGDCEESKERGLIVAVEATSRNLCEEDVMRLGYQTKRCMFLLVTLKVGKLVIL